VRYADYQVDPDRLLTFIETEVFRSASRKCRLSDDDLSELQTLILRRPGAGAVIRGTGGVRKLRFSPSRRKLGKSGAYRALYCFFEEYGVVLLATIYSKTRQDDISAADKKAIQEMILQQYRLFAKGADDE
jgi:hypothetical protein